MRLFGRRRRREPAGSLRLGEHSEMDSDYSVYVTSEHRFPQTYASVWEEATALERADRSCRRWISLVAVPDPRFGVADLRAEISGLPAGYLRPPHLDRLGRRILDANVVSVEVPGLIEWGPAGPTLRIRAAEAMPTEGP